MKSTIMRFFFLFSLLKKNQQIIHRLLPLTKILFEFHTILEKHPRQLRQRLDGWLSDWVLLVGIT